MSNLDAHKKLLKYSFDKIKTTADYIKKLSFLNEFRENGVIDQTTYDQLLDFLEEKRMKLKV